MSTEVVRSIVLCIFAIAMACGQQYDTVLRGGHVIDPGNGIDARMDVAVAGNRIAAVAAAIPASQSRKVVDVSGFYVVPGLVDLHAHVFGYSGSLVPDETALPGGATTIVDAGGSGWKTFDKFRGSVITHSKTRVLALLNIVGAGMVGEPYESNTEDMDPAKTADMIVHNRDVIVGIKTAHYSKPGWTAIDRAVDAGKRAGVPVMVDDKIFTNTGRTTREELLDHLRPGDIHTHMYNDRQIELIDRFTGKVQPWMLEARKRGVLFDVGHGGGSFLWPVATRAMAQGFPPDTISTDLHSSSIAMQQSDMPNVMSKMMLLGMSLHDAVLRSAVNPAKAIHRYPELGTLSVGAVADIAILEEQSGVFAFKDAWPAKRLGTRRLQCVLTIRDGKTVYERAGGLAPTPPGTPGIYDLLLKDDRQTDVAVIGNKIARIGRDLPAAHARLVVEIGGYSIKSDALREGGVANIEVLAGQRSILRVRNGVIVWDTEGLSLPDWQHAGPYSNFK